MKFLKYLVAMVVAITLVACGGGGGGGSTTGDGTSTPELPASVEVLVSTNAVTSGGSVVDITAFVKNKTNVAMAGQAVSFSASSGVLTVSSSSTDDNGVATAKLSAGSDKAVRDITVTVTSGSVSGQVVVPVTGTTLSIAGSGALQAGGAATQYTIRAMDSSNNPIRDAKVSVSSALGNPLTSKSLTTDATGSATFLYTPNIAGDDKLNVSGLGVSSSAMVNVNAIDFIALSPASDTTIPVGTSQTISVRYRLSGAGVAGKTVAFTTTRGTFAAETASTDASGVASVQVSSTTAGPATIVAQIAGVGQVNLSVQFVATTPATIVVQANPGAVLPNTSGTTANQSTIEAVVRDSAGNAVANRQVNFSTLQDVSNGTLSPGVATTDSNGRAQVQFIPGANSTPANGVIVKAKVASTSISSTATLTVNGKALFITLGFGNTIDNLDVTTYSKTFSVYVTDANGVAVGNQSVSISVIPEDYYKGQLFLNPLDGWYQSISVICSNEDANGDGVLDLGEDRNGNGQLTPGNVVVAAPGSVKTDDSGRATFNLQYGEQYAEWVKVQIAARATVGGTESKQLTSFKLTHAKDDWVVDVTPAGRYSPFGISSSCFDKN